MSYYKATYAELDANVQHLLSLPLVQKLIKENEELKQENKQLVNSLMTLIKQTANLVPLQTPVSIPSPTTRTSLALIRSLMLCKSSFTLFPPLPKRLSGRGPAGVVGFLKGGL